MPTITFSHDDLCALVGKELSQEELVALLACCKGEAEGVDSETGEVSVSLDDTNLPYLWSVEGIARLLKGLLGIEQGIPALPVERKGDSSRQVIVDPSVASVRPYLVSFIAKGKALDDYLLKQLIQLQEKFCEGYGRRRQKVSIGLYRSSTLSWPLHYKAVAPESVRFVPLEGDGEMDLSEILATHPKGKEYAWVLAGHKHYPIFMDASGKVLSFPPIINSDDLGRLETGDTEFLFEATGLDEEAVNLSSAVFAQALADRGYVIEGVQVQYTDRIVATPVLEAQRIIVSVADASALLGVALDDARMKRLLGKARLGYADGSIVVPAWRHDIMHPVDVIEDIGIAYGFENMGSLPLTSYTVGRSTPLVAACDKARELCVGLGMQEVFSAMLTSKELLYDKTCTPDIGTVEIKEYMSETYSVVRSWLLPGLLSVLSKNKHRGYPQHLFEQGAVTVLEQVGVAKTSKGVKGAGEGGHTVAVDHEKIGIVLCDSVVDYTAARQVADVLLRGFGLFGDDGSAVSVMEQDHPLFISGRGAAVMLIGENGKQGREVGIIGEVSPEVLAKFGMELPVVAVELDVGALASLR